MAQTGLVQVHVMRAAAQTGAAMSVREHGFSPYRHAYEGLLAVVAGRSSAASETVTLKVNAKGDVQPEVVAVVRDGESLMSAYSRASEVLSEAQRAFANGVETETPFD